MGDEQSHTVETVRYTAAQSLQYFAPGSRPLQSFHRPVTIHTEDGLDLQQ